MRFRSTVQLGGKTATGIPVPEDVVTGLGSSRRPAVRVTVNGRHTYRSTVAPYAGAYMIALSAENRAAAGVHAGDEIDVDLELDTEPRDVAVPEDLAAALDADPETRRRFDALSYSRRRAHVLAVEGAKTPDTRARRVAKVLEELRRA